MEWERDKENRGKCHICIFQSNALSEGTITWHGISTGKCRLERANSCYEQKPEGVVESENFKILWDFIGTLRLDIVFIDKKERLS